MRQPVGKYLRFSGRAIWFAAELTLFVAAFLGVMWRSRGKPAPAARSHWLQWCSRRTLRVFAVQVEAQGPRPDSGLLVSNHLSYLDILVLVSLLPAVFVSKSEVRRWPVFGWFARMAGTLFVDRNRRSDVVRMNAEITRTLAGGNVLVLFPEGTSWNGSEVLPFKSSLLEPAVGTTPPVSVDHLSYALDDGSVPDEVCYWADMTFLPHFLNLMTKRQVHAQVKFAVVPQPERDRKALARQLHAAVTKLAAPANEYRPAAASR